ncbi:MAG TPA: MFS transporter [Thermoanaerobaculia bacterium]|nr:MFS transporter [Thermoanaerobaculia bacterium]
MSESTLRKWAPLPVLSLALAIVIIDTTLLNVSLSTLIRELHTNLQSLQWVISAYSLTLAALTVTGGRMGDLFGKRRMFRLGAILFAIGSLQASISNSVHILLIGESLIEGIGAALMMPATASILVSRYRGHDRAVAFGIWGGVAAVASAVGPLLGGFLTSHYSWRWGFRINIFVVALLLAGSVVIDEPEEKHEKKVDVTGVILSALGLFSIVFGVIESTTYGWIRARRPVPFLGDFSFVPIAIFAGVAILIVFARWEQQCELNGGTPIVSMKLFRNQHFMAGATITGLLMLSQNGVIFSIPVFLQSVNNLDAFHTGLSLLPMSITLLIVSPGAGFLTKRVPHKRIVQTGLAISVVALLVLRWSLHVGMSIWGLAPGLALYGLGMGMVLSQVNNLTLSAVPVRDAGEASGVMNTFRQVGAALGAAIIGAILLSTIVTNLQSAIDESPAIAAQEKPKLDASLRMEAPALAFGGAEVFSEVPPATRAQLGEMRRVATTAGDRTALLCGAGFAFLALLTSLWLPLRPAEH